MEGAEAAVGDVPPPTPRPLQAQPIQPQFMHPSVAALRGSGVPGAASSGSRRCVSAPTSPRAVSTGGSSARRTESPQTLIRVR